MYIPTYIDNKKLSPTFLWVSKFDVKLGVGEQNFQNYPMYVFDGIGSGRTVIKSVLQCSSYFLGI